MYAVKHRGKTVPPPTRGFFTFLLVSEETEGAVCEVDDRREDDKSYYPTPKGIEQGQA